MEPKNNMSLEFLSISENEAFARAAVGAFLAQLDPTVEEISDVKMAVSEAVTNAVVHGYEGTVGKVRVNVDMFDDYAVIEVSDNGRGIENVELARKPLYSTNTDQERSGMGFTVMETFMDVVEVNSEPNNGTIVKMTKKFMR